MRVDVIALSKPRDCGSQRGSRVNVSGHRGVGRVLLVWGVAIVFESPEGKLLADGPVRRHVAAVPDHAAVQDRVVAGALLIARDAVAVTIRARPHPTGLVAELLLVAVVAALPVLFAALEMVGEGEDFVVGAARRRHAARKAGTSEVGVGSICVVLFDVLLVRQCSRKPFVAAADLAGDLSEVVLTVVAGNRRWWRGRGRRWGGGGVGWRWRQIGWWVDGGDVWRWSWREVGWRLGCEAVVVAALLSDGRRASAGSPLPLLGGVTVLWAFICLSSGRVAITFVAVLFATFASWLLLRSHPSIDFVAPSLFMTGGGATCTSRVAQLL